jgi:hypothetical protein
MSDEIEVRYCDFARSHLSNVPVIRLTPDPSRSMATLGIKSVSENCPIEFTGLLPPILTMFPDLILNFFFCNKRLNFTSLQNVYNNILCSNLLIWALTQQMFTNITNKYFFFSLIFFLFLRVAPCCAYYCVVGMKTVIKQSENIVAIKAPKRL